MREFTGKTNENNYLSKEGREKAIRVIMKKQKRIICERNVTNINI